jgi:hypothetical protein
MLFCCSLAAAESLSTEQTLDIITQLTNRSRRTWIPAGTIKAVHSEYQAAETLDETQIQQAINERTESYQADTQKHELSEQLQKMKLDAVAYNVRYELSNESQMTSDVTLKYNGEKFYWQIEVTSRSDSVKKPLELAHNSMTNDFNIDFNRKRVFVWDGRRYTTYTLPVNSAVVDADGRIPHSVNGPLTAGVIPWGSGNLTYEKLNSPELQAEKKYIDNRHVIELTAQTQDGLSISAVLYPKKDYAAKSFSIASLDKSSYIHKEYSDYKLTDCGWIPYEIFIGEYEKDTDKLLGSDIWNIESIDCNTPADYEFDVDYQHRASVEYFSGINYNSEKYFYSADTDTGELLTERLLFSAAKADTTAQNCATAAAKYIGKQFGKDFDYRNLSQLADTDDTQTSLEQLKSYLQARGLYCSAVKLDIHQLKALQGCKVILYLESRGHFVVLDKIDNTSVWCIDLSNNKFYYPTDLAFFNSDWSGGEALIVSDEYIDGDFRRLSPLQQSQIKGGSGYSCDKLLQDSWTIFCDYIAGECAGIYEDYFLRWGCEAAESGSCPYGIFEKKRTSPCINHLEYPVLCDVTGEWTYYYMFACE